MTPEMIGLLGVGALLLMFSPLALVSAIAVA